jgi:hypothetical protein
MKGMISRCCYWYVYLVDVGALYLAHFSEVVAHESAVVVAHSAGLLPALVGVEAEFLPLAVQLLALLGQHVHEGLLLVSQQLILQLLQLQVVLKATPLIGILCSP